MKILEKFCSDIHNKCPFHLFVVKFQTGHWSYFFSENVVKLQQSFKKMMQFYIYCAVPGPKWSQLNKFHMYFSSVKSLTLYPLEISFHPEEWIGEAIYIASYPWDFTIFMLKVVYNC